ncbi:chromodomain Y-like protein [Elysia marginata]|uniref:Chromodomain Y-like protein n=1 Tax=Elysia marginata TaxID=1093978 RepID=A0AAV4FKD8_9GAST|nr:chromodomain Y-like protein [Elysia marginata]
MVSIVVVVVEVLSSNERGEGVPLTDKIKERGVRRSASEVDLEQRSVSSMASFSDDEKFDVESILEQRKRKGNLEYLVRWKGAGDGSDTWEPAKTIAADCAQAVQAFLARTKATKAKRSTSRSRKVSRSRSRSSSRSRRSRSANKTTSKSPSTRSRGRSQKKEEKVESSLNDSQKLLKSTATVASHSSTSVQVTTKSVEESTISEQKTYSQETMPARQRVLRSSTMEARKELEVQRVHNDQRPVREDDAKPRSAIWRVADYAVIVLFVLSLIAAFFLFLEKILDLEDFKKQFYPNMGVLKRRLFSAQQRMVDFAEAGVNLAADGWLYLVEQIKGSSTKGTEIPSKASSSGA